MATHRTINQVFIVLLVCVLAGLGAPASAGTSLSKHGDWEAFTDRESGKLVCYMGTVPTKSRGKYTKRGQTFLLITHRPAEQSKNVISLQAGYTFEKTSEVELAIGETSFKLFTDEQWAFAADTATDNELVKSMIGGAALIVRGLSSRGTETTDTYSLKGFTAAYKAIGKACKI
ncbi:MAG: invasion associated locus B family protein [Alphaproteobacteria bacterium]|nr:invasion associated locus B family protein [Alphaproteobacteria bacterium]